MSRVREADDGAQREHPLDGLADPWPVGSKERDYFEALREKYDKNVDLGWEPVAAMARARREVHHYGEVL